MYTLKMRVRSFLERERERGRKGTRIENDSGMKYDGRWCRRRRVFPEWIPSRLFCLFDSSDENTSIRL